jgi:hypothetical protein
MTLQIHGMPEDEKDKLVADMYEALKELWIVTRDTAYNHQALIKAKQAIDKAEGK